MVLNGFDLLIKVQRCKLAAEKYKIVAPYTDSPEESYAGVVVDTALLAGQIMLECNAETYRVEDTMNHILRSSGFETCEAYAMATGIMVSIDDPLIPSKTEVRRVRGKSTNLEKITRVNEISRQIATDEIDIYEALDKLKNLEETPYSPILRDIGMAVMCGAYAALFGAGIPEILVASLAAVVLPIIYAADKKYNLGFFVTNVVSIILMVCVIVWIKKLWLPDLRAGVSIIGCIMPAVPGIAITNAIRDTFRGDYNSGVARMAEAVVIALSVAIGVALGLTISGGYL